MASMWYPLHLSVCLHVRCVCHLEDAENFSTCTVMMFGGDMQASAVAFCHPLIYLRSFSPLNASRV